MLSSSAQGTGGRPTEDSTAAMGLWSATIVEARCPPSSHRLHRPTARVIVFPRPADTHEHEHMDDTMSSSGSWTE
ncbi:unnamed protein product [Cutaneotrichosporon oleaginosum]